MSTSLSERSRLVAVSIPRQESWQDRRTGMSVKLFRIGVNMLAIALFVFLVLTSSSATFSAPGADPSGPAIGQAWAA